MARSSFRLALIGDVMLGRLVNEILAKKPPSHPWGDTLPILLGADFRLCNLECAISDNGEPWTLTPKEFRFRSDSKNTAVLQIAGINAVALANNHVLDCGYAALFDTLELLDTAGISRAGAGRNDKEARRPAVARINGSKIGLIAFTDNEPEWEAMRDAPGVFYVSLDLKDSRALRLFEEVKDVRREVDILILSAHWGPNWGYEPPEDHIRFAHSLIDAGAAVVFGHSGHVFRGIEIYKHRPILYCAGDFIDDYAVDSVERNDESFIYELEISGHEVLLARLYPTRIAHCQAKLAGRQARSRIAEKMERLSSKLRTRSDWNEIRGYLDIVVNRQHLC